MSIDLVSLALRAQIAPASHKLALIQLAEGTNSKSGVVWRSRASVAVCVGVSPRAAHRILAELLAMGVIDVVGKRSGGDRGSVNVYRINEAKLRALGAPEVVHTGDIQTTPTGDIQVTPERGEGWSIGAARGGLQTTQTGIEPSIQAAAVDNSAAVACEGGSNSRHQEGKHQSAAARARLAAVGESLAAKLSAP